MNRYEIAMDLAAFGFHVFPVVKGKKIPAIKNFPEEATLDSDKIAEWFASRKISPLYKGDVPNIGISTSRFGDDKALLVIDVDNKDGKNGDAELLKLELEGYELPDTFEQRTPTGGRHLIFQCDAPVRQGVNVLGPGLDIRSWGGFVVGVGSEVQAGVYSAAYRPVAEAPAWLIERCGQRPEKDPHANEAVVELDTPEAISRVAYYLEHDAPIAVYKGGGDATTYAVAAKVKDFGVSAQTCLDMMFDIWNPRCPPGWKYERLKEKVDHAYHYGQEPIGSKSAKAEFAPVDPIFQEIPEEEKAKLSPIEQLNTEYAFVISGGGHHILWERKDQNGDYELYHLAEGSFHKKLASQRMAVSNSKLSPISELWMSDVKRRSYDGLCFIPGKPAPAGWHNLWRGFKVEPADEPVTAEARHAVDEFFRHAKENVCGGNEELYQWLIGYFAHLIQKPWEKPLVALVFRGGKGVGKNALVDRVGYLLGNHYLLTSNRRYLVGNFNGHLENCLLFALDEAFWSGDKQAEGTLKDLITGSHHVIERKGQETYTVNNVTRVVIIGNEDWLVPASHDERRFAVFDVGDGRKQDRDYFRTMREGMERGGYRLLLRVLQDWDISKIDVNDAPATRALADQKIQSLDMFYQWWFECLCEGHLVGSDFETDWSEECDKERLRSAFYRYLRDRNARARAPESIAIGKMLKKCVPSVVTDQKRREGDKMVNVYRFPPLAAARQEWCKFIGHEFSWSGT